jgi:hypothetical protein
MLGQRILLGERTISGQQWRGRVARIAAEVTNDRHRLLLRSGSERPVDRTKADNGDKFAPPHFDHPREQPIAQGLDLATPKSREFLADGIVIRSSVCKTMYTASASASVRGSLYGTSSVTISP